MRGIAGSASHKSFEHCNAVLRPFRAKGRLYMLLVAGKPIRNSDETVADYGNDYIFDDGEPVVHAQHRTE